MESVRRLSPEIYDALSCSGIILTGNQRAARTLRLDFDRQQRANGLISWQPPAIFAWDTWLASLWHQILLEGHSDRILLNRTQELHLWRSCISTDAQWSSLQSIDSLAAMAADAWQRLCAYRGQQRLNELGVSGDTRSFQRWARTFSRRCKSDLYLPPSELELAITESTFRPAINEILLIGFDSITPAQRSLLDTFSEAGISITHPSPAPAASELHLSAADDPDDELIRAALWLRRALESNPELRIAVIHPDIASERAEIDRVFREILAPELNDITTNAASSPYEFSLGRPLSHQPMIAIAMKLLRWTIAPLSLEEISHLILSPYFAARTSERSIRAEFDAFGLRKTRLLRPELDLPSFIHQAERKSNLSDLQRQLHGLYRTVSKLLADSKQRSFADWSDSIRELLQNAGWAAATADTSIEFQTRRKWESTLDELATLDFEGTRASFSQAIDNLEQIAQRTLFAPESRGAPIQIMSPLEAAGSCFDAVYFLRASDLSWPTRPRLNPFLGWRLQRELQLPGSDPAQDAEHARRITSRLVASARTVVFSYARQTADAHQRPSPALASLSLTPLPTPPVPAPLGIIDLEILNDSANISIEDPKIQGGSSVLQLQAACGFRAFAEKRLSSAAPESREPGMDARERGNIVHAALEDLWNQLRTQANLRALTPEERTAALTSAIDHSLRKVQVANASAWDAAYLDLQHERLYRLLTPWLEVELARPPFEVQLREQKYEDLPIGPLLLSLRVDRVDRVFNEDGEELGEIILDYKTGIASPSDWQGERPDEPQLPLYAALREYGTVAGIAFASLRAGKEMDLRGLAAGEGVLPKTAKHAFATLEDQIADWRRILTSLAIDFANGDARVRPKNYPTTCEFCQQRILCRLDPATLEDLNEEADETDV
jgi:ATP-dependent helicase/nuclease subunit B